MKHATLSAVVLVAALLPATAFAAKRVPQIDVTGDNLKTYFAAHDAGVVVDDDGGADTGTQDLTQIWRTTVSGNTSATLQIQLSSTDPARELGIYNAFDGKKFKLFDQTAGAGWFAVASFLPGNQLKVNLFDDTGTLQGFNQEGGVEPNGFGFYLAPDAKNTWFTQDAKNTDALAHALVYPGTDANLGCWWVCFEDGLPAQAIVSETDDFDDAVIFVESVNTSPVSKATWASVKARFR